MRIIRITRTNLKIIEGKFYDDIKNYFAQCAGYAIMFEERTGIPITNSVIIIGVANEEPQLFVEHRDNYTDYLLECRDLYENNA